MNSAGRSALMAGAILSLVFCLATPVAAQKDERTAPVAQEDEAAALAASAAALHRAGRISEAIPLAQQVLAIREKQLGPDHPDVEKAINDLAQAYHDQGRFMDAEPLFRRALAMQEKALGPEHPSTAPPKFVGGPAGRGRFVAAIVAIDRTLSYKTSEVA